MSRKNEDLKRLVNVLCEHTGDEPVYSSDDFGYEDEEAGLWNAMFTHVDVQLWNKSLKREKTYKDICTDINDNTYRHRNAEAFEHYRQEGIRKIKEEKDPLKKLDIYHEYAGTLREDLKMYDFMEYVSEQTRLLVSIEVCGHMFDAGYSLADVKTMLPWLELSDIYGLSKMLDYDIVATDEELEQIRESYGKTGKPEVLKVVFGEEE